MGSWSKAAAPIIRQARQTGHLRLKDLVDAIQSATNETPYAIHFDHNMGRMGDMRQVLDFVTDYPASYWFNVGSDVEVDYKDAGKFIYQRQRLWG